MKKINIVLIIILIMIFILSSCGTERYLENIQNLDYPNSNVDANPHADEPNTGEPEARLFG